MEIINSLPLKIPTKDLADILGCKSSTIRRGLCVNGHYMGLKPIKLPNGRLRWSSASALELLKG